MTRFDRSLLLALPLISLAGEVIRSFTTATAVLAGRNILCLMLTGYLVLRYLHQVLKFSWSLAVLAIYTIILLVVQEAPIDAYTEWAMIFESRFLFPLAFILLADHRSFIRLNKVILRIGILFFFFLTLFLIVGIGENQYGGEGGFTVGAFKFGRIYTGSFVLLTLPVIWSQIHSRRIPYIIPILALGILIILMISTRRSALVIVFIGLVFQLWFHRHQIGKILRWTFAAMLAVAACFPLYKDVLFKQLELRSHVFVEQQGLDIESETRYEESIAVWRERIETSRPGLFIFGDHLFNSAGHYDNGIHGDRPLHLDLTVMLHGSGLLGLLLYLVFYFELFFRYLRTSTGIRSPEIHAAFLGYFASLVFLLFSGGMTSVTFNMMAALYIGSILGQAARRTENKIPARGFVVHHN